MSRPEIVVQIQCANRDYDTINLEESIILDAMSKVAADAFAARGLPAPEWLSNQRRALNRLIIVKTQEDLEYRLKKAEQRRTQLMTPGEQREAVDAEIAALRAALGEHTPNVPSS